MTTPFEKRKERTLQELLEHPAVKFANDAITLQALRSGTSGYTGEENLSEWLSKSLDTLAKEVAQVAVVEEDEYFYDFDKPDTDKEELAQEWYETMAEAEAGGNNRARSQSIQQLKDYGIDVEGV